MAAMKRTRAQRAADLVIIEGLALKGATETQIADKLSEMRPYTLSRQQIGYDLRKLAKMWAAEAVANLDEHKALALAEVRHLQRTYWDAWERSCKDAETLRQEGSGEAPSKIVKTSKGQAGDPRFLTGVQWCIERRCKIIGVDAPTQQEHSGPGGGPLEVTQIELTNDERAARVAAILDTARARRDRQAGDARLVEDPA